MLQLIVSQPMTICPDGVKKTTSKCNLCNNTGTLHHILNSCYNMLDRYAWRLNNILSHIVKLFNNCAMKDSITVYSDLEGHNIAGGTIPPNILPTALKPDIVIVWPNSKRLSIIELTVPFETNLDSAKTRKTDKYSSLCSDIRASGYTVDFWTLEIGSRGYVNKTNLSTIKTLEKIFNYDVKAKCISVSLSKLALLGSYSIYNSRKEPVWNINSYLSI